MTRAEIAEVVQDVARDRHLVARSLETPRLTFIVSRGGQAEQRARIVFPEDQINPGEHYRFKRSGTVANDTDPYAKNCRRCSNGARAVDERKTA